MEAKELKIGNWALDGFGKPFRILGIISKENTGGYKLSTLHPIPLTSEILEKCGFDKVDNDSYQLTALLGFILWGRDGSVSLYDDELGNEIGEPVIYLHQLQNFYFALTGEELEVKL